MKTEHYLTHILIIVSQNIFETLKVDTLLALIVLSIHFDVDIYVSLTHEQIQVKAGPWHLLLLGRFLWASATNIHKRLSTQRLKYVFLHQQEELHCRETGSQHLI